LERPKSSFQLATASNHGGEMQCELPEAIASSKGASIHRKEEEEVEEAHAKSLKWSGWSRYEFGLEVQEPWASAIVEGRKRIETRSYELPPSLLLGRKRILILQSPAGKPGVSGMGDYIDLTLSKSPNIDDVRVIGYCIFDSVKKYKTQESFEADEKDHLVTSNSGYEWKQRKTMCGWVVQTCGPIDEAELKNFSSGIRRMRSLFQIIKLDDSGEEKEF